MRYSSATNKLDAALARQRFLRGEDPLREGILALKCNAAPVSALYVFVLAVPPMLGSKEKVMFLGIAGVLFLLWIVGEVLTHGASLAIHILAIVWIISLIGHFFSGRKG